jgi:2-C-methyl-D-erythritol 4-phosphate cytidylyltransferase / 2-C-methyl-D-erythritol 2,4-cyclodiphosphate synthase
MFGHSLRAAALSGSIDDAVLVAPESQLEVAMRMSSDLADGVRVTAVVAGGDSRRESTLRGLSAALDASVVVCHDAARPFASPALYDRVVAAVAGDVRGAIPGIRSPDTVKDVRDGRVAQTFPRDGLVLAQTPQAFDADALRSVHERASEEGLDVTDDAMLLERAGLAVAVVQGEEMNFKITTEADMRRAEWLVASSEL